MTPRTPEHFPDMKVRGGRRRNGQRATQFDRAACLTAADSLADKFGALVDIVHRTNPDIFRLARALTDAASTSVARFPHTFHLPIGGDQ